MTDKPVRRAKKAKSDDLPAPDMSMTDAFFPGGDEPAPAVADTMSAPPAKARRSRKPEAQFDSESSAPADDSATASSAPSSIATADAVSSAAAARWDAESGAATFDWPAIEAVAAVGGANQAMAKLLLAARAEGANSRWPF